MSARDPLCGACIDGVPPHVAGCPRGPRAEAVCGAEGPEGLRCAMPPGCKIDHVAHGRAWPVSAPSPEERDWLGTPVPEMDDRDFRAMALSCGEQAKALQEDMTPVETAYALAEWTQTLASALCERVARAGAREEALAAEVERLRRELADLRAAPVREAERRFDAFSAEVDERMRSARKWP